MANDLTINPIKLDTSVANSAAMSGQITKWQDPLRVYKIYWTNPAAVGDTFSIMAMPAVLFEP